MAEEEVQKPKRETFETYISTGTEFEERFKHQIDGMCTRLTLSNKPLESCLSIVDKIFERDADDVDDCDMDPYYIVEKVHLWCRIILVACERLSKLSEIVRMNRMLRFMYESAILCGIDEELKKEQPIHIQHNIIQKLDADKDKFKKVILRAKAAYDETEYEFCMLLGFFRACFIIHGYQAPVRFEPKKAIEDAMDMTDTYVELMRECGILGLS
jgi:hypothetical protein